MLQYHIRGHILSANQSKIDPHGQNPNYLNISAAKKLKLPLPGEHKNHFKNAPLINKLLKIFLSVEKTKLKKCVKNTEKVETDAKASTK